MTKTIKPVTTIDQIIEELGAEKTSQNSHVTFFQHNNCKMYISMDRDRYVISVAAPQPYAGSSHFHSEEKWSNTTTKITVSAHKTPAEIKKDIDRRIDWAGIQEVKEQHEKEVEATKNYVQAAEALAQTIHRVVGGRMEQKEPGRHIIHLTGDWYTNSAAEIVISGGRVSFDFQSMSNPRDIAIMTEAIKGLKTKTY